MERTGFVRDKRRGGKAPWKKRSILWPLSSCPPAPLGRVPVSFSTPYSAAKFALDSFFGSLRRELDVQDVNVAITMCVLGLWDPASTVEGVR